MLDLQNFLVDTLPDDGTVQPKHVGAGTCYEVCLVFYCIELIYFVGFKIQNN